MTHRQKRWNRWDDGFFEAIPLPYEAHPEGGLKVIRPMTLNEEVTFKCPCHYTFHELLKCWLMDALTYEEGDKFMPAVEIPAAGYEYSRGYVLGHMPLPELRSDEFWEDDFLFYHDTEYSL